MPDEPFFSVVLPVYNKEPFIRRAAQSILSQTFSNFELIIVCDPSTDGSEVEVRKLDDPRIQVLYRDAAGPGGYAARNLGIDTSAGKWVVFLDADDKWYPDNLESMAELAARYPDVDVMTCARVIEESGQTGVDQFSSHFDLPDRIFDFSDYLHYSFSLDKPFHPNSVGIRRNILDGMKLFPEGRAERSGDVYAWVKLMASARRFAWSSHAGSHLFKDIVGVTKLSVPRIGLFQEMVCELENDCNPRELILLRRYANKLIVKAWYENKRVGHLQGSLGRYLYWSASPAFCFFWLLRSYISPKIIETMRKGRDFVRNRRI